LKLKLDRIVIGLGSSNAEPSQNNPLSATQREGLIIQSLALHFPNHKIDIVPIPDFETDEAWTCYTMDVIRPTHIISGNEWTKACFANQGVKIIDPIVEEPISATEIRQAFVY
jgi:nicotinamide mononucleotide adenylyltransferase